MFELTYFTSNLHEARKKSTIHLKGHALRLISLSKLIGVILGRSVSFGYNLANIITKAVSRYCVLTSLTPKQWDWMNDQLTEVDEALYVGVLMHGAPAWQTWLATTHLERWWATEGPPSNALGTQLNNNNTIQNISRNVRTRFPVLASLTSNGCVFRKDQLIKINKDLQVNDLTYAAPAWQPWVAPSRIEQLELPQVIREDKSYLLPWL